MPFVIIKKMCRYFLLASLGLSVLPLTLAQALEPLSDPKGWQLLSYSSLPPNQVNIDNQEMVIRVNGSASPVIYPFKRPLSIDEISFNIQIEGKLTNTTGQRQGEKGSDDFLFRLGVVYEGEQRLSYFQRAIAADWVKTLFGLAPDGAGVDHIAFYNVYSDERLAGQERVHPASDLLKEYFVVKVEEGDGKQPLVIRPDPGKKIVALWISSDGDDTGSAFEVQLSDFEVRVK